MTAALMAAALAFSAPPAVEALEVTVVAPKPQADDIATSLAPRLGESGFTDVEFVRCPDFGCITAPETGDGPEVVVLAGRPDGAVVIVSDGGEAIVERLDVEEPLTAVDREALGFSVSRALTAPPEHLRMTWHDAEALGLEYAPPPEPLVPEPVPAPVTPKRRPAAYDRGPYVDLSFGGVTSMGGAFRYGAVAALAGGFMFEGRATSGFRIRVGGRVHGTGAPDGIAAAEVRTALGWAGERVLVLGHIGAGPAVVYGDYYGGAQLTGVASAAGSLRGHVGKRGTLGVEAGVVFDIADLNAIVQGLFVASWTWDVPKKRGPKR